MHHHASHAADGSRGGRTLTARKRAPSRAAFASVLYWYIARPNSVIPKVMATSSETSPELNERQTLLSFL